MDLKVRETADAIIDAFEDLLNEKGIDIPCAEADEEAARHEDNNTARIFGSEYYMLEDLICGILAKAMPER